MTIEVRVSRTSVRRGYASAHVVIDEENSFTLSNIVVCDNGGKPKILMPLSQVGTQKRTPNVTLQGRLKQVMTNAIWETFLAARANPAGRASSKLDV